MNLWCMRVWHPLQIDPFGFHKHSSCHPHYPERDCSFCRRRVETIGTNHGVLDISTIDASSCYAQIACFRTQAIEGFTHEQSPAALTKHRTSFWFFYRSLSVRFILGNGRKLPIIGTPGFLPRSTLYRELGANRAQMRPQGFRGVARLQIC
jgi:hypothetical protein